MQAGAPSLRLLVLHLLGPRGARGLRLGLQRLDGALVVRNRDALPLGLLLRIVLLFCQLPAAATESMRDAKLRRTL